MKRLIAIILVCTLAMVGCASNADVVTNVTQESEVEKSEIEETEERESDEEVIGIPNPNYKEKSYEIEKASQFSNLNDADLLSYVEREIYKNVESELGDGYIVENVSTAYISKEYLEEMAYNSQSNIFFGYSLAELEAQFQGTKYVFTLGDDGNTIVVPFEEYDDTYEKVLKNVAIGTGVILVCVTVSVVSGGLGAPAVSMVFAASAKSGAIFAASSGALSGVISGTVTGIQTGDFDQALKAGSLAGSESFKWGAISGSVLGGSSELLTLKKAASGGLTLDEAAVLMKDAKLPANFLSQIKSVEEYNELVAAAEAAGMTIQDVSAVCMSTGYPLEIVKLFRSTQEGAVYFEQAGLYAENINGQMALIRSIDLTYESELAGKTVTNLERMRLGYAALDPATGQAYQLHHIGQSVDSPLAILTQAEHTGGGNNGILHDLNIADGEGVHALISDAEWGVQREEFWEAMYVFFSKM